MKRFYQSFICINLMFLSCTSKADCERIANRAFTISGIDTLGQKLSRVDLLGNWVINNKDSSYYKSDIVELHQDANYRYIYGAGSCDFVEWRIEKKKFCLVNMYTCSEPGIETVPKQDAIYLRDEEEKQIIEINREDQRIDKFEVIEIKKSRVNRYPHDIKLLRLKRIEKK